MERADAKAEVALFTRDLRVADNPVLVSAGVDGIPLYVKETQDEASHVSFNQRAFLCESLTDLDGSLRSLGSSLVYREGAWLAEVKKVVQDSGAQRVHIARGVTADAQDRVTALASGLDIPVVVHSSFTVIDPTKLSPHSASYYQRFTPYYKRWRVADRRSVLPAPQHLRKHSLVSQTIPSPASGAGSPLRQHAGEGRVREALGNWLAESASYGSSRDQLAQDGTSRMSAALHFGQLSPLEVVEAAEEYGATAFARQLAWRDFNYQLLFHRPDLERASLRPSRAQSRVDDQLVDLWKQGRTGYPVIDASMRQLRATGWMHNRGRMLAASFLTKHLLQDWRVGARWFREWLTDADVANNQLGWQWAAGVGVDTNPWRMFNPTLQSRRYDPDGAYIREWVPELADADVDDIHDPSDRTRALFGYPTRVVDHSTAVTRFKQRIKTDQA